MSNFEFLLKINFDKENYITPMGIHDSLLNISDFDSFYELIIRDDKPLNDKKPYRLVFMNGREKVQLYNNLLNEYEIELDPEVIKSTSIGLTKKEELNLQKMS